MSQRQINTDSWPSYRPNVAIFLPLAPAIEDAPPASVLSELPTTTLQPFKDISKDTRLDRWSRSIHACPAAYPRSLIGSSVYNSVLPKYPQSRDGKSIADELRASNLEAKRRVDHTQNDEPQLFLAVARYFIDTERDQNRNWPPVTEKEPITLILTHANGLHKETWEPMLAHLLLSSAGNNIEEIWALDCVNQGDSAILNRQSLGLRFDGSDYARDILNFVLFYLPNKRSCRSTIATVLPRLECPNRTFFLLDKSTPSISTGPIDWRGRRLGLIGHSMGGCATVLAATSIPELFHRVILIDPALSPIESFTSACNKRYAASAVVRRDQWEDSTEALEKFKENTKFFGRWHPKVLERYAEYGLESTRPARLKCNKLHEASNATEPHERIYQAYCRLLDYFEKGSHPYFNLFIILADSDCSLVPEDIVDLHPCVYRSGLVVRIKRGGHLLVQENPVALAFQISQNLTGLIQPRVRTPAIRTSRL